MAAGMAVPKVGGLNGATSAVSGMRSERVMTRLPTEPPRWLSLGERGGFVGMTGFGASGPAEVLYQHFGITPEAIVAEARRLLAIQPESATA